MVDVAVVVDGHVAADGAALGTLASRQLFVMGCLESFYEAQGIPRAEHQLLNIVQSYSHKDHQLVPQLRSKYGVSPRLDFLESRLRC